MPLLRISTANSPQFNKAWDIIRDKKPLDKIGNPLKELISDPVLLTTRDLDNAYNNNFNLLLLAVKSCNYDAVNVLLQAKIDIETKDRNGLTALALAVTLGDEKIIALLLEHQADIYAKNNEGYSILLLMLNTNIRPSKKNAILYLLITAGLNFLFDWDAMIISCGSTVILKMLLDKIPLINALFELILSEQSEIRVNQYINAHLPPSLDPSLNSDAQMLFGLEALFLWSTYHKKFTVGEIIFKQISIYATKIKMSALENPVEKNDKLCGNVNWDNIQLEFPNEMSLKKQISLRNAFIKISRLFANSTKCVELLKPLDQLIATYSLSLNCDFHTIKPGESKPFLYSFELPGTPEVTLPIEDKSDLLIFLMRPLFQKYDIEKQDTLYTFCGFVNPSDADEIIKQGALFKEHFLIGNGLLHGIYSHYLHFYIICRAIEEKEIILDEDITLRDVMTAFVEVNVRNSGWSVWQQLIDFTPLQSFSNMPISEFNIGAPHRLNNLLLLSEQTPHLRGYLLCSFYHSIRKFCQFSIQYHDCNIPYECLIGAQVVTYNNFSAFAFDHNYVDVNEFLLEENNDTEIQLNQKTGIITESASKKFSAIKQKISNNALTQSGVSPLGLFSNGPVRRQREENQVSLIFRSDHFDI